MGNYRGRVAVAPTGRRVDYVTALTVSGTLPHGWPTTLLSAPRPEGGGFIGHVGERRCRNLEMLEGKVL